MPFKTAHCLSSAKHLSRAFPHPISRTTTGRVYTAGGHIQNAAGFFLRWDVCALCVAASYSSLLACILLFTLVLILLIRPKTCGTDRMQKQSSLYSSL